MSSQNPHNPPPDDQGRPGQVSIDNAASNQGAQGVMRDVTIHHHYAPALPPDAPRSQMLAKVRAIWIAGVLEQSLYSLVQLQPGLRSDPRKVDLPIRALVQEAGGPAEDLPDGTPIASVFDRFGGTLLILGAPGAGKTTLLLELCRELLDRAAADLTLPMPIVFPLSTWAAEHKPLAAWLVDQLVTLYQVRRKAAAAWVAQDQVLPLLDGLDEVAEAHRPACVTAINAFRAERGTLPLVVCSRLREYETVAQEVAQLRLHGAVIVQTLRRAAVLDALGALGPEAAGLRDFLAAHERDWLWSVATSPLGLSVLIPAVRHDPTLVQLGGCDDERRDRIFGAYVDAMFERRSAGVRWSREETICLLSWLAAQMQRRGQTLFLLEGLQPGWLPKRWQQRMALWSAGIGSGLLFGLFFGLDFDLPNMLFFGLVGGMLGGLIGEVESRRSNQTIQPVERLRWSWDATWRYARVQHTSASKAGLILVAICLGLLLWLLGGISSALLLGLFLGLLLGLLEGFKPETVGASQQPNQAIVGSARIGLFAAPLSGLLSGLFFELPAGLFSGLLFGLFFGGYAVIQHYALRFLLARAGLAPLRYAAFLDHAAGRVLLRRVGGGWVFVHRLLLDYFAGLAPGLGVVSEGEEKR